MSQVSNMYCNTCKIAGKSQSEYTSHNTKTKNAKTGKVEVTCPIVLAAVCTYCNGTGHWKKYCKILEKDEKTTKKLSNISAKSTQIPKKNTEKPVASNRFLVLDSDDAEDEERVEVQKPTEIALPPKITWSSIVAKSAPVAAARPLQLQVQPVYYGRHNAKRSRNDEDEDDALYCSRICFDMEKKVGYMKPAGGGVKKSWADYTSDDDESGSDEE
jgi:hypothetical protein